MKRAGPLAAALLALAVLAAALACGCSCGKKSDEEILRAKIDALPVHLYLASKIGILKADQSPAAKAARDELFALIAAARGSGAPTASGGKALTAADTVAFGKALWGLRSEGKELLASGDEKGLGPVLPLLFSPEPALAAVLDLPTEHALLLMGLFALKLHPRSPVPVPDPILLYEAWMTDAGKLRLTGLAPVVRGVKAVVYGQHELCDLSAKEGAGAEADAAQAGALVTDLGVVAGTTPKLSAKDAARILASVRAVAHGAAAGCYLGRDQKDKALEELDGFLAAAEDLGVPRRDTALLRAYVALQRGKRDEARQILVEAKDDPATDAATKERIDELVTHLEDEGAVAKLFDRPFFATQAARIVIRELDRTGAFDDVKSSELARAIDGYLGAAAGAIGNAKELATGKGIMDRLKGKKD